MKNIFKLLITIAIFYYLFQNINIKDLQVILLKSHTLWIIVAIFLQLSSTYLAAYRWFKISKLLIFTEYLSFYMKSYFKGTFFNQLLPSSIGGDAIRMLDLANKGYTKKEAFYGVFVDRIIGLVGLLTLNFIASILFYGVFEHSFAQLIIFISLSGIIGFLSLFLLIKIKFLEKYKLLNLLYKLSKRLNSLYNSKIILINHVFISVVVHLLSVLTMYAISLSIDANISLQILLIAVPPVFLLSIVPISLAGWGIREGAMIGIFTLVGVNTTNILAISILYGILLIICSLPGSYFWIKNNKTTNEEIK